MLPLLGGGFVPATAQPAADNRSSAEPAGRVERRFRDTDSPAGEVDPFAYTLSIRMTERDDYAMPWQVLEVTGASTRTTPGDADHHTMAYVDVKVHPGLIDVVLTKASDVVNHGRRDPTPVPAVRFWADVGDVRLPVDRPTYLRVRFRGTDEYFALTYAGDRGLRLESVRVRFGHVGAGAVKGFKVVEATEPGRTYRGDNHAVACIEGDKELWRRRIPLDSAPKEVRPVGAALLVRSTGGHSLLLRKSDGKIVFYHTAELAGKDPWTELLELAQSAYRKAEPPDYDIGLTRYVGAAALLGDRRAAPFLIECLDKGDGLGERWWAVAALEHLNGNSVPWRGLNEGQPWDPTVRRAEVDDDRVRGGLRDEVARWEKVFGRPARPLLIRTAR